MQDILYLLKCLQKVIKEAKCAKRGFSWLFVLDKVKEDEGDSFVYTPGKSI